MTNGGLEDERGRWSRRPGLLLWTALVVAATTVLPLFIIVTQAERLAHISPPANLASWAIVLLPSPLIAQALFTARKGYVYCGRTDTISRKQDPLMFWAWFAIQVLAALLGMTLLLALLQGRDFWAAA